MANCLLMPNLRCTFASTISAAFHQIPWYPDNVQHSFHATRVPCNANPFLSLQYTTKSHKSMCLLKNITKWPFKTFSYPPFWQLRAVNDFLPFDWSAIWLVNLDWFKFAGSKMESWQAQQVPNNCDFHTFSGISDIHWIIVTNLFIVKNVQQPENRRSLYFAVYMNWITRKCGGIMSQFWWEMCTSDLAWADNWTFDHPTLRSCGSFPLWTTFIF